MNNTQKRICPKCNYPGDKQDSVCPCCGVSLISPCPWRKAPIRVAFAKYCYRCGVQFSEAIATRNRLNFREECLQTGEAAGADIRDGCLSAKGVSK